MKINDIIKISIKSLRRNRKKNKLLYIPLIIMLVILFIVDIIQYSTNNYINKIGKGIELRKISGIEYIPSKYEETKNEIEKIKHVEWVYNQEEERVFSVLYCKQFSAETQGVFIWLYPATENVLPDLVSGRGIQENDEYVAIIPNKIYVNSESMTITDQIREGEEYLNGNDFLGKEITIENDDKGIAKKFKVVGVYDNQSNNQSDVVYIPAKTVKEINQELEYDPGYYRLNVVVDDISNIEYVEQEMRDKNLLKRDRISTKLNENGYRDTDTLSGNIASVTSITKESQKAIKNIITGFLIVATIVFMMILIITNNNKTYISNVDIGLMKIEGYTNKDIQKITIIENILVCIISIIIALVATALIVMLFNVIVNNFISKDTIGLTANKIREQLYNIQKVKKSINPLYLFEISAITIILESINTYLLNRRMLSKNINKILRGDL